MRRRTLQNVAALLTLCAISADAQYDPRAPLTPEIILLARVRNVASENLKRVPNYTCTQTIERSRRRGRAGRFELVDTLRLEVTLVGTKELYAWAGAKKFDDRDVNEIVKGGAIGNGDFALHAAAIFLGNEARFTYAGKEDLNGRQAHRFDYTVAQSASHYHVRLPPNEGIVGYHGSTWHDPETLDLLRLDMYVDEIPPHLFLKESYKRLDYARVAIGNDSFMIPQNSEMTMLMMDGSESRNRTTFASCHQFMGESTLTFDDPAARPETPAAAVEIRMPAGLTAVTKLQSQLDLKKAAKGDLVKFELSRDVKQKGVVWLEKGAVLEARITEMVCRDFPTAHCFVVLKPVDFASPTRTGRWDATIESPAIERMFVVPPISTMRPADRVPLEIRQLPPGSCILLFAGGRLRVPSGYAVNWRTLEVSGGSQ